MVLQRHIPTTTPPIILTTPDISEEVIEGLAEVQEPSNKNDNNLLNTDDDGKTLNQTSNVAVVGKAALKIFTTSLAAAKPFLPWIESVTIIINDIVNQYETVEYNKKTCLVLVERVEMINLSVKTLTRRRDENLDKFQNEDYYHSFIKLEKVLKLVKDFIGDISELKGYRKFILAADVKSKANQLLIKLEDCCNNLQFTIIISQETRTREQQSLDDDVANMTKFLKSIDAEGKETSRTVNRIYEEVAVFSQLITNLANLAGEMKEMKQNKQTIFSAPTISPRELYDTEESVSDIPTNRNDVVKKLLRNAIPVACKTLNIFEDSPNEPARIKTELSILNSIQSSNKIIKFHGQSEINGHPVLVFDWAEHGNLKGLYERGPLSWGEKLKIAHDIASGLVFLQACQVYHHDIRCENILITGDTRYGTYEAKIAKFRQSREHQQRSYELRTYKIMSHVKSKKRETFEDFNTTSLSNGLYPSDNKESIAKGFTRIIDSAWAHEPKQRPTINNIYQELDSLMELNSRKRLSSQSLQSVSDDSNNIITPEEDEDNLTTLETILTLEEGIAAHRNGMKDIAWKCFEIHATLGDPLAIYWKAYYYLKGYYTTPSTPNTNEAIKHFKQAADANVPEAQYYFANALEKAKKPGYLFLEYFTKAADNDNVLAQRELGRIYYYGLNGVEKNEEKGIQYLKLAALKNNQNAINDLKTINPELLVVLSADDKKSVEI
ncbi:6678_t:CDS:2 [Rhizophagus irregularis]|nr:6678_t:CDS:2 [Rhizophagus irregularis]